jgi:flagellar hook-basal body complex protein FliE
MLPPVAPISDFQLPALEGTGPAGGTDTGGGFGKALSSALDSLQASQTEATNQAQALATGQAEDISSVVLATERASLELQLAAQIRGKLVEAYQDIFRMQV